MVESEITFQRSLSIWWSFVWRSVLVSIVLGAFLGFIGAVVAVLLGRPQLGSRLGGLLGWLGSIPGSIWALKEALAQKHAGHRVALLPEA